MMSSNGTKTAGEIINEFISNLENIEGMDKETAKIIQKLWGEDKLGRDELLFEFKTARTKDGKYAEEKA